MDFGYALGVLKAGGRVRRTSWGHGWLTVVRAAPGASVGTVQPVMPEQPGFWALGIGVHSQTFTEREWSTPPPLAPWIGMRASDNAFTPWSPTHADLLATDWDVAS